MTTRIKLRRDTAANWLDSNPILAAGEPGLETDTGKIKYGDGVTAYADLPHAGGDTLNDDGSVVVQAGSTAHWITTQRRNDNDVLPRALRYDSAGNLYALTLSNDNSNTLTVITKYSAAGAVLWQKSFTDREPLSLAIDSSDQAYAVTKFGPELQIIKFSTAGSVLWDKNYNYEQGAELQNAFIEEKSSTSLVVAIAVTTGPNYALLMDISATDGTINTKKTLEVDGNNLYPTGIDVTDNGTTVYVSGYYYDSVNSVNKMFVEKMNSSLVRIWTKSIASDSTYDIYGGDCASDALGNIYAVGVYQVDSINSQGNTSNSAGILTKLNSSGVVQWTRRIGPGPCGGFAAGLTATDTGEVYLSAITFAKKVDGQFSDQDDFTQEGYGDNKLIVARYDTLGAVLWQRYVDVAHLYENFDNETQRGQAITVYENKFALDGYGGTWNTTPFNFGGSDDNEYDCFIVQLPTDGTELTIGDLKFTESRVPGRFITLAATDISSTIVLDTDSGDNLTITNFTTTVDAEARVANNIVKSEVYSYTFGADGTLTIPNDGDLRLTQTQTGYFMAIGGSLNYDDDIVSRATCVDSQGNMYVVGEESDNSQPFVLKISPTGERLWSIRIEDNDNGDNGRANAVAIHPTTGNLMVVCEMYSNYTYSTLVTMDQDTGRILDNVKYSDSDADVYLNDIAYNSLNDYVLAGSKEGEFSNEFPVTAQTGSTTGTIIVLRSELSGLVPNSWQIGGTGITPFENIQYVNRYTGLTGTVRQGSGAVFNIQDNTDGSYAIAEITNGGSDYLPGHKIKILGTALGGTTPTNDAVITVSTVESGVITNATISGLAPLVSPDPVTGYPNTTGTNTDVGSGFILSFEGPRNTNNYTNYYTYGITASGSNYVENDIIVIAGTSLGGTSPANDLNVRVYASGGSVQYVNEFSGTSQSTTWKLETTTQVDFSLSGSWSITYPLSRENLLITEDWTRTFGINDNEIDRLYAVAVDTGNNIIAVGQGYGRLSEGNEDDLAVVYKFNSAGTLQWSRKLNERDYDCYAKSVITIGTDIYVTHDSNDDGETVVTKLDASGTVKWQRITDSGDDSIIARTADGNILVTAEAYNEDIDDDALKVFLLTPSGETVYKRWVFGTTDADTRFKNGRCLATDATSYYITAYFYANDYNSSIAARLPVDGSGTGEYGSFRYTDVNAMTGSFAESGITGVNYDINEVNLEDENNYAGSLVETPYVKTTSTFTTSTGTFYVDTLGTDYNLETVRDTDGGNIVFADGTTQNTSATDIPQRRYTGQRYTLGMGDRGHHILCNNADDEILVPYNARVEFPIGTVITIVNDSGGSVYIGAEGGSMQIMLAGDGNYSYFQMSNYGIATLLKIGRDRWTISGNVQSN